MSSTIRRRSILAATPVALAAPWLRGAQAQDRSITLMAYTGIFEDRYRAAVIEPFMRANPGIRVTYFASPTSAQMLGQLRAQRAAPQVNLCIMDMTVAKAGTDESLMEPVTPAQLSVMNELHPNAIIPGVAGPAVTFDNLVLVYAPGRVTPAPTSWRELWNPQHRGQIGIPAAPDIQGLALTLIANRMAGGTDYTRTVEPGIAMMADLAPAVQTWDPRPDVYTAIINGTQTIGIGWNARAQVFSGQNPDRLAVSLPEEGSVFQVNTLNLVKGSPNAEASLAFMRYALGQEAQKAFTETMFYAPTNARAAVAPEAMARTAATPERMARMLDVNWLEVARIRDGVTEQWRRRIVNRR
jgi:putative spermidine/putrescine transport system substrate-binding protein